MKKVRTRFAPSPTGYLHIGGLRTALYAYLIAKKNNGSFLLRIEDTDQDRFVEGAVEQILRTLDLVGLKHDEGPDIGGPYGPYVQSERKPIYMEYAKKLIELGGAYYCFCSKERLDKLRKEAEQRGETFKYDKHCLHLSKEEVEAKLAAGEPYVIRQNVPTTGTTTFHDEVFGTITVENSTLDDGVLIKSDGLPTYNFANVIDDHLMEINPVVRGSEYLSSTPKYNLLYEAFGWEIPTYIHLSPVMKDAHRKLSKRDGDASFEDFYNKGFLKEAILNYVALLGWSPGGEQEFFTLDELVEVFSVEGINKSPAIFDINKLRWMNGEYIKRKAPEEFYELALPYIKKAVTREDMDFKKLCSLLQSRVEVLSEIPDIIAFLETLPDYEVELYVHKKMKTNLENSLESLERLYPVLEAVEDWKEETIHDAVFKLIESMGVKNGQVLWPLRVALSGKEASPGGGIELAYLLGKEESLRRVQIGIEKLSKASK